MKLVKHRLKTRYTAVCAVDLHFINRGKIRVDICDVSTETSERSGESVPPIPLQSIPVFGAKCTTPF